jgi:hypothetical protein
VCRRCRFCFFHMRVTWQPSHIAVWSPSSNLESYNNTSAVVVVIVWQLDIRLPMQFMPITTNVVTSLLVYETTGENHWPVASHWQTLLHNVASSKPRLNGTRSHNVSGNGHELHVLYVQTSPRSEMMGSCKCLSHASNMATLTYCCVIT